MNQEAPAASATWELNYQGRDSPGMAPFLGNWWTTTSRKNKAWGEYIVAADFEDFGYTLTTSVLWAPTGRPIDYCARVLSIRLLCGDGKPVSTFVHRGRLTGRFWFRREWTVLAVPFFCGMTSHRWSLHWWFMFKQITKKSVESLLNVPRGTLCWLTTWNVQHLHCHVSTSLTASLSCAPSLIYSSLKQNF